MENNGYWYCHHCRVEVDCHTVTYQELHETCGHQAVWIENNGITPDRICELVNAEREQRVVVLPCKVGDTVYFLDDAHPTATIEEIKITNSKTEYCWVQYETDPETCELWDEGYFTDDDIGKTVFLTPEAAQAALDGGAK